VLPLQVVDFNFNRFNDLILVARDGIYGYVQVRFSELLMPDATHNDVCNAISTLTLAFTSRRFAASAEFRSALSLHVSLLRVR